jgi:hypothetical protein
VSADTITAICSVVIAVASLGVSAYVAWATRKHNRLSVRPLLELTITFPVGATAGLRLSNSGLGPAKITSSQLMFGDEQLGDFSRHHVDKLRDRLAVPSHAISLGGQPFLDTDYEQFLLWVDSYDPEQHREFREVILSRLQLKIQYDSVYGGEGFMVVYPRSG